MEKRTRRKHLISKKECPKCKGFIGLNAFKRHFNVCEGINKTHKKSPIKIIENIDYIVINEKCKCIYKNCQSKKLYSNKGIGMHIWRNHGAGKNWTANNDDYKNGSRIIWNKGLTKMSNKSVRRGAETLKENIRIGKVKPAFLGRKHTNETIIKMLTTHIRNLDEHPEYFQHFLEKKRTDGESYLEERFREELEKRNINFIQEYRHGLFLYDFAFPKEKFDIEIDGMQHKKKIRKLKDRVRDNWSIKKGWKVIRFSKKEVINDVSACVDYIIEVSKNELLS